MSNPNKNSDLIWVTQAMVEYGHSRGWYRTRQIAKIFNVVLREGETKIYLHRTEIEAYLRTHPDEDVRNQPKEDTSG